MQDKTASLQQMIGGMQALLTQISSPQRKQFVRQVLSAIRQMRTISAVERLEKQQKMQLRRLLRAINCYQNAYQSLIKTPKYSHLTPFKSLEFLLSIQPNLTPAKTLYQFYTGAILLSKSNHAGWPRSFFVEWGQNGSSALKEIEAQAEQRKVVVPKKEEYALYSSSQERRQEEEKKPFVQHKQIKEKRNRTEVLMKYLEGKKEVLGGAKTKEIAEYLSERLDQFMKRTLLNIIEVAKLNNRSECMVLDEVSHFGETVGRRGNIVIGTDQCQPVEKDNSVTIGRVMFQHKLEIYTQLRSKELKIEDAMQRELEKKWEEEKKLDKKVENYVVKAREGEDIQEWVENQNVKNNDILAIGMPHVLYYLQNHPWFKHSQLLFHAYQC